MISTRNHALKKKSSNEGMKMDFLHLQQKRKIEQLFHKKFLLCPQQLLRYAYGGIPLWVTQQEQSSSLSSSCCPGCNELRVFEMELMPTALVYLENINSSDTKCQNDEINVDTKRSPADTSPLGLSSGHPVSLTLTDSAHRRRD
jgi:hypothetical protein